jgi:hypothetical protein
VRPALRQGDTLDLVRVDHEHEGVATCPIDVRVEEVACLSIQERAHEVWIERLCIVVAEIVDPLFEALPGIGRRLSRTKSELGFQLRQSAVRKQEHHTRERNLQGLRFLESGEALLLDVGRGGKREDA